MVSYSLFSSSNKQTCSPQKPTILYEMPLVKPPGSPGALKFLVHVTKSPLFLPTIFINSSFYISYSFSNSL